jgi:cytochrome P450
MAGAPTSSFATVPHNLHRLRRMALNPFFSKRSIGAIEPLIVSKIELLCRRFEDAIKTKEVIRLDAAYMALTMDIITHYAYGQSYNYLAEDDFKLSWKETVIGASANGAFLRQFPWALPIMRAIPFSLLQKINPHASALVGWQRSVRQLVDNIILANREGKKVEGTIFQALLDSDLPWQEKTADHLQDEGQVVIAAGSETTAKALSFITFYLLQDKNKLRRLRKELCSAMPTPNSQASLTTLEQLPYLVGLGPLAIFEQCETYTGMQTAVINEGIRLMHGVTTRLPRVSPTEPLTYKNWTIPAGVSNAPPTSFPGSQARLSQTLILTPSLQ